MSDWLTVLEREYLTDFIPQGGSAVKFAVVGPSLEPDEVRGDLARLARETGCLYVSVEATSTKLHMIDQFFFAVARQLDWNDLARRFLLRLLAEGGFTVPPGSATIDYQSIADANDYSEPELRRDIRLLLTSRVFRDFAMAQEFRIAMVRLCQAQLEAGGSAGPEADAVKEWLRGELRSIVLLKAALIFQRIARHNGRDMFLSLAHWVRLAGYQGLVLSLDAERYFVERLPVERDGSLFHTTTAVMDAYEVFRQFIDATDESEGSLLVVTTPPSFLEDPKRGLERYDPLDLRIWDEVRDRRVANPLASLVRLRADAGRAAA
ncbi:MAG TPA: BREX system ATP-binding domain-containing protein [Thermomicrobiales bacterium]|nr:BREX system ATP-binding domain-containing protein [Thermomicrobiales bacterium]